MASIQKHGSRWRVQVYVHGRRESQVFRTRTQAAAWALEREAELSGEQLPNKAVADLLTRYGEEVAPAHKGSRWELMRIARMKADALGAVAVAALSASDVSAYRDRRLQSVSGASVRREMNLLGSALEIARREWGWLRTNPMHDVRKPTSPPSRRRRISPDETTRLTLAFGLSEGLRVDSAMQRTGLAFLFALETAMRAGEITGITPDAVHTKERYVRLPRTKNGDVRDVPLSTRAVEIINVLLPLEWSPVWNLDAAIRDVMFRRARDAAKIPDLHFHDSRAEAIFRLSKKLDVLELARVIGHRDLKSLMMYYAATPQELAAKLD